MSSHAATRADSRALTDGFHRALLLSSIFVLGAAVIALRATNTRGEPTSEITGIAGAGDEEAAGTPAAGDLAARPESEVAP